MAHLDRLLRVGGQAPFGLLLIPVSQLAIGLETDTLISTNSDMARLGIYPFP